MENWPPAAGSQADSAACASRSEYFPRIVHRRVRETPVIDLMQDAF